MTNLPRIFYMSMLVYAAHRAIHCTMYTMYIYKYKYSQTTFDRSTVCIAYNAYIRVYSNTNHIPLRKNHFPSTIYQRMELMKGFSFSGITFQGPRVIQQIMSMNLSPATPAPRTSTPPTHPLPARRHCVLFTSTLCPKI